MKAAAKLKDEARKFEQREEWEQAIQAYSEVLRSAQGHEIEAELPLFNRVGDLYVRLGKPVDAVSFYEQAADHYAEAGLYNNAIALCNKALRYLPNRLELLRKLGQFSAAQGFLTDARRWYLEYAERQLKLGALDEAFTALEDFATVYEDAEIRELLGRQLRAHNRIAPAVTALKRAYTLRVQAGDHKLADALRAEILQLAPHEQITAVPATEPDDVPAPPPTRPAYFSEPEPEPEEEPLPFLEPEPLGLESAASAAFGLEAEQQEIAPAAAYQEVHGEPVLEEEFLEGDVEDALEFLTEPDRSAAVESPPVFAVEQVAVDPAAAFEAEALEEIDRFAGADEPAAFEPFVAEPVPVEFEDPDFLAGPSPIVEQQAFLEEVETLEPGPVSFEEEVPEVWPEPEPQVEETVYHAEEVAVVEPPASPPFQHEPGVVQPVATESDAFLDDPEPLPFLEYTEGEAPLGEETSAPLFDLDTLDFGGFGNASGPPAFPVTTGLEPAEPWVPGGSAAAAAAEDYTADQPAAPAEPIGGLSGELLFASDAAPSMEFEVPAPPEPEPLFPDLDFPAFDFEPRPTAPPPPSVAAPEPRGFEYEPPPFRPEPRGFEYESPPVFEVERVDAIADAAVPAAEPEVEIETPSEEVLVAEQEVALPEPAGAPLEAAEFASPEVEYESAASAEPLPPADSEPWEAEAVAAPAPDSELPLAASRSDSEPVVEVMEPEAEVEPVAVAPLVDVPEAAPELGEAATTPAAGAERELELAAADPAMEFARVQDDVHLGETDGVPHRLEELHPRLAAAGRYHDAWDASELLLRFEQPGVRLLQQRVEYASALGERDLLLRSYLDLARHFMKNGSETKGRVIYQRVLDIDPGHVEARTAVHGAAPIATTSGYVDLFSLVSEEDDGASTRFVVAEQAPTGDEDRDFSDMLSQFKQKVAENLSPDEGGAHYDLGLAFKEMGLIDEAIAEFQTAMKGGQERLKIYEELGQCFLLKQQYNVAVNVLSRALQLPVKDESDLLGVYYTLGRSYEELGQRVDARAAYERVIGLDINFRDAAQRLASL